ncbi:MAG: zinc ABC transporter substrate-binding protein [Syntrophaceae bacterium]
MNPSGASPISRGKRVSSGWQIMVVLTATFMVMVAGSTFAQAVPPRVKAFVSILPQAYFVQRVGGNLVEVDVLVGPGMSVETYEPTPRQISRLAHANVYFRMGLPFEDRLAPKISRLFPGVKIVDMRTGLHLLTLDDTSARSGVAGHSAGAKVPDPHIWLDPKQVKIQAGTICDALSSIDPTHGRVYRANCDRFLKDLDVLDAKIARTLAPIRGSRIYVFHPAFGYFTHSYGLIQVPVEIEGKEPSPRQLSRLIDKARLDGVRVIFVQPQFSKKGARAIAQAIRGAVMEINPLPRDYLSEMGAMAETIEKALKGR